MPDVERDLAARLERGEEAVLATVVRLDGEPPSRAGAKLLLDRGSILAGTLGCAEFDSAARADAAGLLDAGAPELRTYRHDLGSIEVYLEPYLRPAWLLVGGETPTARQLAAWAPELGFRTAAAVTDVPPAAELYAVFTDHDEGGLVDRLREVLGRDPRFVGVMGSRRHTGHHLEALRALGLPEEAVSRIQSPVGLDLGGRTPAEIAVSILAGLVAVRHGASGGWKDSHKA